MSPQVVCTSPNVTLTSSKREGLSQQTQVLSNETMKAYDHLLNRKVDLVEICTPWDSPLSKEVERKGGLAIRLGCHNGYDLSTRAGFLASAKVLRENKPRNVHFSPPCFPWSQFQNLNQRTPTQCEELHIKREIGRKIFKHLEKLAQIQLYEVGGDLSGEQPWTASSWKEPSWSRISRMAGGRFRVDGCRYGMKHPSNEKLLQKGWGFFATHPGIRRMIAKTCNHPPEQHCPIEGKITASTAEYPKALCRQFVLGLLDRRADFTELCHLVHSFQHSLKKQCNPKDCTGVYVGGEPEAENSAPGNEGEPRDDAGEVEQPENPEEEVEDLEGLTAAEWQRLKLLHRNLGHPTSEVLVRMLKEAHASDRFVTAARQLQCDICIRQAQKKPVLPATPHVPKQKWNVISVDTFWWKHPCKDEEGREQHAIGLSYMDEATDLHVATIIREDVRMPPSITGDEFKESFLNDWLKCLPKPKVLRSDVEGCFKKWSVIEWLEEQLIQVSPIAGEAAWQIGKHSRHLHTLKMQMTKLGQELGHTIGAKELCALSVSAKNEIHSIKGYSPNQWAFGQNSDRVFSTLKCYEHLPNMTSENPSFHENIKNMARAREVFIQCDSERKIQRAVHLKSRRQQEFSPGMLVYYYRKGRSFGAKVRGQWHGPARVLFMEKTSLGDRSNQGSIVWISHGTMLLRCAPEQLQPVSRDLSEIDDTVNGPFSPDEFLKGKHVYQDLFDEKDELHQEVADDDETVWQKDPDQMDVLIDKSPEEFPEPKRVRLTGKHNPDQIAGQPSHEQPVRASEDRAEGEGSSGSRQDPQRVLPDVTHGSRTSTAQARSPRWQDLRLGLGEQIRLRRMVCRTPPQRSEVGPIPPVHRPEDDRGGAGNQEQAEGVPEAEGQGYHPIRSRGSVQRRREWLECNHRGNDEGEGSRISRERGDQGDVEADHGGHGDDDEPSLESRGSDPAPSSAPAPTAVSRKREPSMPRSLDHQEDTKRVRTSFQRSQQKHETGVVSETQVCEIVLFVGPRDIHMEKHGRVGTWVVNAKAKKGAEVKLRELQENEVEEFRKAKQKEIDSYVEHAAMDIVSKVGIDENRILGMRWILTWKNEEDGEGNVTGKRPKARLIIKGFQDPDLLRIPRDSPTLSTVGRNLLFSISSHHNWDLSIGDIKTAFLNGDDTEYDREIYGEPPEDAKEMLKMTPQQVCRIRKAIYGLLNAPRQWAEKLAKELRAGGWCQSKLEPCLWRLYSQNELRGVLGIHVDDIVTSGKGVVYENKVKELRKLFPFGSWKNARNETVTFCGCEVKQKGCGEIVMSQERYSLGLSEVNLSRERKQEEQLEATEDERKAMKGLLGGLAWRANQTAPWMSATTSILQGCSQSATVSDILQTNKLCRLQRCYSELGLSFTSRIENPVVVTFSDASWANRRDGSSQGGSLTVLTDSKILEGKRAPFSILGSHSRKLKRVSRSSTSAEVQACANAYDDLEFVKQIYYEVYHESGINVSCADQQISTIPSAVVCDAKNLYDSVTRITSAGLQLEEKRLCLEVINIKERASSINAVLRWVDSDQQLADDLTKLFSVDKILEVLKQKEICITFDSTFMSAKKKRQLKGKGSD